jgi:hypothetical protein
MARPKIASTSKDMVKEIKIDVEKVAKKPTRLKCEHGKRKDQYFLHSLYIGIDCGGNGICEHGKHRAYCKDCKGSQICIHNKRKQNCLECDGSSICHHNKYKYSCKICKTPCIPHGVKYCFSCLIRSFDVRQKRVDTSE